MQLNRKNQFTETTLMGAPAARMTALQALRRSVMSCMLFEHDGFEDGEKLSERIRRLALELPPEQVAELAIETREEGKLRHVPLLLLSALAQTGAGKAGLVTSTIAKVIRRPDEMGELLALHAAVQNVPQNQIKRVMSAQMKKGLAQAFTKFDAYQLAKYNRDVGVRLRDVLFLTHAKPKDEAQAAVWAKLVDGTLEAPDTWEVALSGGADKKETFTRLIEERRLGYLALLRNLRSMMEAGVDRDLVVEAILARRGAENVLPFRFVAAARACPQLEGALDAALMEQIQDLPAFGGRTIVLVDVSGSMSVPLSRKSDMARKDAACALASIITGNIRTFTFSQKVVEVPHRLGMAGVDTLWRSQSNSSTYLGQALREINKIPHDRLIVITDEQSHDGVGYPARGVKGYMINVASHRNGVGYGPWTHIDGFSENVLRFIHAHEAAGEGLAA